MNSFSLLMRMSSGHKESKNYCNVWTFSGMIMEKETACKIQKLTTDVFCCLSLCKNNIRRTVLLNLVNKEAFDTHVSRPAISVAPNPQGTGKAAGLRHAAVPVVVAVSGSLMQLLQDILKFLGNG